MNKIYRCVEDVDSYKKGQITDSLSLIKSNIYNINTIKRSFEEYNCPKVGDIIPHIKLNSFIYEDENYAYKGDKAFRRFGIKNLLEIDTVINLVGEDYFKVGSILECHIRIKGWIEHCFPTPNITPKYKLGQEVEIGGIRKVLLAIKPFNSYVLFRYIFSENINDIIGIPSPIGNGIPINGEVIKCSTEKELDFSTKILRNKGYSGIDNIYQKFRASYPEEELAINPIIKEKRLYYSRASWYKKEGFKVVSIKEWLKKYSFPKFKIGDRVKVIPGGYYIYAPHIGIFGSNIKFKPYKSENMVVEYITITDIVLGINGEWWYKGNNYENHISEDGLSLVEIKKEVVKDNRKFKFSIGDTVMVKKGATTKSFHFLRTEITDFAKAEGGYECVITDRACLNNGKIWYELSSDGRRHMSIREDGIELVEEENFSIQDCPKVIMDTTTESLSKLAKPPLSTYENTTKVLYGEITDRGSIYTRKTSSPDLFQSPVLLNTPNKKNSLFIINK